MGILSGKTAIVTGGGKGIGFGIAKAFAKEGANLVLTGRVESRLLDAQQALERDYGIQVLPVAAEGADESAIDRVVSGAVERFGHIDALVNNAQASHSGVSLVDHTKEQFDLAIYSGLYATFFYMKKCHPHLKESKGSVINFASGAGLFGKLGQASYAAAKEGVRGLSRVAAAEWGPDGINVNVICPLAMTESLEQWRKDYPELFEKTIQGIPMGRFADAERDIGAMCVFLCSDAGAYITGETITIQGGSGLRP